MGIWGSFQDYLKKIVFFSVIITPSWSQQTSLTIYNSNFAVVRDNLELELSKEINEIEFTGIPNTIETQSVMLRSLDPKQTIQIYEQGYRGDVLDQNRMLKYFEGKSISFEIQHGDTKIIKPGKIIRASQAQSIIEIDGQLRFGLPGTPLFPRLSNESVLKPALLWKLHSSRTGKTSLELSYIANKLGWRADYNFVENQQGSKVSMTAWITMRNDTLHRFRQAKVKLMAGDVNRLAQNTRQVFRKEVMAVADMASSPSVTEKSLDEFHLYTLQRPITLDSKSSKQIEFIRAENINITKRYEYKGSPNVPSNWRDSAPRTGRNFGVGNNTKVGVYRIFKNAKQQGLGMPLPKGRVRFYRQDDDKQLEFVGENQIDHTATESEIKLFFGYTFDVTGDRVQTSFKVNSTKKEAYESTTG